MPPSVSQAKEAARRHAPDPTYRQRYEKDWDFAVRLCRAVGRMLADEFVGSGPSCRKSRGTPTCNCRTPGRTSLLFFF